MTSDLARALDDTITHLDTYVVFASHHQSRAIALWLAYTHAINLSSHAAPPFDVAPYLLVTSPERQSGKSTLKDVMKPIAARGHGNDGITPAALIRLLRYRPTLFLDEIDTVFKSDRGEGGADNEMIRAVLNSGFHVNGQFQKVLMSKDKVESYPTFGPKALFGIGQVVPETVTSRSIRIRLQRKERGQATTQRARLRRINQEGEALNDALARAMAVTALREVPESEFDPRLSDRAVDLWEPLYAVADRAGDDWPTWVRFAAIELATGESEEDDESLGEMLLRDIRTILDAHGAGVILRRTSSVAPRTPTSSSAIRPRGCARWRSARGPSTGAAGRSAHGRSPRC